MSGDDHNNTTETWGDCDNTTHVCSCAVWASGAIEHDDNCNIWLNPPARGEVAL